MSHGHAKRGQWSPTYKSWRYMRDRVARDPDYVGVTICERWNEFESFLADMGEQPDDKTLDRIDNGKGYAPENCRWATAVEQARNRTNNKHLTFGAVTRTVAEWAAHVGLSPKTLYSRIAYGWPTERVLSSPHRGWNKQGRMS